MGGDAVHRVFAVRAEREWVIVEVENQTPAPFALALAIRPYNLERQAQIGDIAIEDGVVVVNDRPALVVPRPPGRVVASDLVGGDCALLLEEAGDDEDDRSAVHGDAASRR